jgi:pimeloyl-ACP methyl ester carboxylesterase
MRTIGRAGRELDKIGPAIVVTHSQSGLFGWLLATRRPNLVKAVISYEPGFVFPEGAVPPRSRSSPARWPSAIRCLRPSSPI